MIEYCDTVWDTHVQRDILSLEKLNTKAARFISNDYRVLDGITTTLKNKHNLHPLIERRKFHRLVLMYKIKNNLIDINKEQYLFEHGRRGLRHNPSWLDITARTNIYKASFFPKTISDWNDLPSHIQDLSSLSLFSDNLQSLLFPST